MMLCAVFLCVCCVCCTKEIHTTNFYSCRNETESEAVRCWSKIHFIDVVNLHIEGIVNQNMNRTTTSKSLHKRFALVNSFGLFLFLCPSGECESFIPLLYGSMLCVTGQRAYRLSLAWFMNMPTAYCNCKKYYKKSTEGWRRYLSCFKIATLYLTAFTVRLTP